MIEDDDLPVLTQVLRTSSGQRPIVSWPIEVLAEPLDVRPFNEMLTMRPLVIGNETRDVHVDEPVEAAVEEIAQAQPEAVADPRHVDGHGPDSFGLSQDHDGARPVTAASLNLIDEPELMPSTEAQPSSMEPLGFDTKFAPADTRALASQVREAVLTDLLGRIDTELDARIAQAMHAEIETALAHLQGNLRTHLTEALRDVVSRAVDEEIARLMQSR
jgi:hypothetical protein